MVGNFSGGLNYFKGTLAPGVGINETASFDPNIKAFPNPINNYVNIDFDNQELIKYAFVEMFDISGRRIYSAKYSSPHRIRISTSEFKKGIYLIRINMLSYKDNKSVKTLKLIKM